MTTVKHTSLIATTFLMGLLATAAHADNVNGGSSNGNNGNHFGTEESRPDNGNHLGQYKQHGDEEENRIVTVSEPESLGLVAGSAVALIVFGLLLRRRRR